MRPGLSTEVRIIMICLPAFSAEAVKSKKDKEERQRLKAERRRKQAAAVAVTVDAAASVSIAARPSSIKAPDTPIAFLFPGQGSQAVGMLKVRCM